MRPSTINEQYFLWLDDLVKQSAPSGRRYGRLTYILFNKEFTWTVPNDGNRLEDGKMLRDIFSDEFANREWDESYDSPCSVLEILVSVANRMEDILYDPKNGNRALKWLWTLICNLGLDIFTDAVYKSDPGSFMQEIDDILEKFIGRTYDRKGQGGLFPLKKPRKDQREVEIWYQMQEYLDENFRY